MPGVLLDMELPVSVPEEKAPPQYELTHQTVTLDIDFATQSLTGTTVLTICPLARNLKEIHIDARQCVLPSNAVTVNGETAEYSYEDPMRKLEIPNHLKWDASQYHLQQSRLEEATRGDGTLHIKFPSKFRILEADQFPDNLRGRGTSAMYGDPRSATPVMTPKPMADQNRYQSFTIAIAFKVPRFRDGLHFVGMSGGDSRYPHVYTKHSVDSRTASCIFPCLDDPAMRCTWEVSIKCSRTLGDAIKTPPSPSQDKHQQGKTRPDVPVTNGVIGINGTAPVGEGMVRLSDDDKLKEMIVVCSGDQVRETVDLGDSSKKQVYFTCTNLVAAHHIGFAIGPFELVDLGSELREEDDEEKLAQGQASPVYGYCLPGRSDELRNSCISVVHALDWLMVHGGAFPFNDAKFVFVDDQLRDVEHTTSLSICSSRLLFRREYIDPEVETLRTLVHALVSQWFGVFMVPDKPADSWITIGLSHFLTGQYMKERMGNNDYMFNQKSKVDKLVEMDVDRPSLSSLGEFLKLGSFEYEFVALKSELVLSILDKRIQKHSGASGLMRVVTKLITIANTSSNTKDSILSMKSFQSIIDKITKYRLTDAFMAQWVHGAGCPRFRITQKFNKKKVCIEMKITQIQGKITTESSDPPALAKNDFLRLYKEEHHNVFAAELQRLFTGPMTIRIHEADGTPYEHTVQINEGSTSFEIPYSTKYRRLKRTKRQRERANPTHDNAELGEEALYYCLGDVLQSRSEMQEWDLYEWDDEMQKTMDAENYEWVRVDSDFEWICAKEFYQMPTYMYISQLQQDRDVVAHYEAMDYLRQEQPHPLLSTFLVRTLMDSRYFWGIRLLAADILQQNAIASCGWIGLKHLKKAYQEFFCYPGSLTPKPNDFQDPRLYNIMKAIPEAASKIRDLDGKCPPAARDFILETLSFNDNQQNMFSDNFKVAGLLSALTTSLIPTKDEQNALHMHDDDDMEDGESAEKRELKQFTESVVDELDRHRRMDEWMLSYRNIYTVTVLKCKFKLMKAGIIPIDPMEFANYIQDGNADDVRLTAFQALLDLGFVTNDAIVAFMMNVASTHGSPYVRNKLFEVLSLGLATVAFDDKPKEKKPPSDDLLVVEDDPTVNLERKARILRTTSIEGALAALKADLGGSAGWKESLWEAVKSSTVGSFEQANLLDVCAILYDPVDRMPIALPLPHYYKAEKTGPASIAFRRTDKVRERMLNPNKYKPKPKPVAAPQLVAQPQPIPARVPGLPAPIKIVGRHPSIPVIPPPSPQIPSSQGSDPQVKSSIVKLKIRGLEGQINARGMGPPQPKRPEASSKLADATPIIKKEITSEKGNRLLKLKRPLESEIHTNGTATLTPPTKKRKIVKCRVSRRTSEAIEIIQSTTPNPAAPAQTKASPLLPRAPSSLPRSSPAPRQSPAPSHVSRPSPAPSNHSMSPAPVRSSTPSKIFIKAGRKPLPGASSTTPAPARKPLPSSAPLPSPNSLKRPAEMEKVSPNKKIRSLMVTLNTDPSRPGRSSRGPTTYL